LSAQTWTVLTLLCNVPNTTLQKLQQVLTIFFKKLVA